MVVLHVSPHPDDECMGAPATLLALRDAGARIVNYACGLGRPADHERRRAELVEACRRGGLELRIADPPLALSRGDDLVAAERELTSRLASLCRALHPAIVVSSSPHDGHHAHELVGRAVRDALAGSGTAWWMWGIWADLPFPTLLTAFDAATCAAHLTPAVCAFTTSSCWLMACCHFCAAPIWKPVRSPTLRLMTRNGPPPQRPLKSFLSIADSMSTNGITISRLGEAWAKRNDSVVSSNVPLPPAPKARLLFKKLAALGPKIKFKWLFFHLLIASRRRRFTSRVTRNVASSNATTAATSEPAKIKIG